MTTTIQSIRSAQYRSEALHAVSRLGLSADGEALAAITELATKHLLFAIELLMNRLVKSQAIEIIRLANTTVDSGQAGERIMKRLASSQTETQESVEALIGKIRSVLIPARATIDRSINLITQDRAPSMAGSSTDKQLRKGIETILDLTFPSDDAPTSELLLKATLQQFLESFHAPHEPIQHGPISSDSPHVGVGVHRAPPVLEGFRATHVTDPIQSVPPAPLATADSTITAEADGSFDLVARAEDDVKYEKILNKLRDLSGDISPPDGWQESVIKTAHAQHNVGVTARDDDGDRAPELSCYAVGDRVLFLRRRPAEENLWSKGTVTRIESWLRQDGTVGHRIEVNEWLDTIGTLQYGGWIYEDGDESTLRLDAKAKASR